MEKVQRLTPSGKVYTIPPSRAKVFVWGETGGSAEGRE
jgi:hypothetical protein